MAPDPVLFRTDYAVIVAYGEFGVVWTRISRWDSKNARATQSCVRSVTCSSITHSIILIHQWWNTVNLCAILAIICLSRRWCSVVHIGLIVGLLKIWCILAYSATTLCFHRVGQQSKPLLHYQQIALKPANEASFSLNLKPDKHYRYTTASPF